jgi:hypothetical protein
VRDDDWCARFVHRDVALDDRLHDVTDEAPAVTSGENSR